MSKMLRKPPIRTYQRKNLMTPVVQLHRSQVNLTPDDRTARRKTVKPRKPVHTEQGTEIDNSLRYDAFDTTFDRLLKGAVLPPLQPVHSDASWLDSSFENADIELKPCVSSHMSTSFHDNSSGFGNGRKKRKKQVQITVKKAILVKTPKSGKKKKLNAKRKKVQHQKPAKRDSLDKSTRDIEHNSEKEFMYNSNEYFYSGSNEICKNTILMNTNSNSSNKVCKETNIICKGNTKRNRKNQNKETHLTVENAVDSFSLLNNSHLMNVSKKHTKKMQRRKKKNEKIIKKSVKDISVIVNAWTELNKENVENINNFSFMVDGDEMSKKQNSNSRINKLSINIKPCSVKLVKCSIGTQSADYSYSFNMQNNLCGFATNAEAVFTKTNSLLSEPEIADSTINETKDCFVRLDRIKPPLKVKVPVKSNQSLFCSTPIGEPKKRSNHLITVSPIIHVESLSLQLSATKDKIKLTHMDNTSTKLEDTCEISNNIDRINSKVESSKEESAHPSTSMCSLDKLERISDHRQDINDLQLEPTQILFSTLSFENLAENKIKPGTDSWYHGSNISNTRKLQSQYILNLSEKSDRSRSLFDDTNNNFNTSDKDNLTNKSNITCDPSSRSVSIMPQRFGNTTQPESPNISHESLLENTHSKKLEKLSSDPKGFNVCLTLQHTEKTDYSQNNSIIEDCKQNCENEEPELDIKDEIINAARRTLDNECPKVNIGRLYNKQKYIGDNETKRLSVRLQDCFRITDRRKRNQKWNLQLADISENQDNAMKASDSEDLQAKKLKTTSVNSINTSSSTNVCDNLVSFKDPSVGPPLRTSIFLKPGKSWTRSLSILNNIQNGFNLDDLSVGKGKKWRHSVNAILSMQKQGIIQSCVKNVGEEKDRRTCYDSIHRNSEHALTVNRHSTFGSANANRFSRRVSVRVVPDNKNLCCVEDTPFREAYGITGTQSRTSVLPKSRDSFQHDIHYFNENLSFDEGHPATTAREVVLQRCEQDDYLAFAECFPDSYLDHCRKIGEGVYGEVFLYEHEQQRSVIKIIPIEGDELVNGEPQKKFDEILSEIVISKELHNLRFTETYNTSGFVEVVSVKCIIGTYPEKLVKLWKIYDEQKSSDNDCPSMFDENQLYIALELGHGGQDLEAFVFQTAVEAHALFVQTALTLAVAEKCLEFEHRDLHWGNVLISRTDESYIHYKLGNKEIYLPSKGVKVSIIDFTLSRMSYEGCCIFNDLALDPALFTAQGEYQFEIYRLMQNKTENNWQNYEPHTNVLWLHYTLDKMITAVRYKKKTLKMHKKAITDLLELKEVVLAYESAFDFVTKCDQFADLCNNSMPAGTSVRTQRTKTWKG